MMKRPRWKYKNDPLRTQLNRNLNPFWGLGPNPLVWVRYWIRRYQRWQRYRSGYYNKDGN